MGPMLGNLRYRLIFIISDKLTSLLDVCANTDLFCVLVLVCVFLCVCSLVCCGTFTHGRRFEDIANTSIHHELGSVELHHSALCLVIQSD